MYYNISDCPYALDVLQHIRLSFPYALDVSKRGRAGSQNWRKTHFQQPPMAARFEPGIADFLPGWFAHIHEVRILLVEISSSQRLIDPLHVSQEL